MSLSSLGSGTDRYSQLQDAMRAAKQRTEPSAVKRTEVAKSIDISSELSKSEQSSKSSKVESRKPISTISTAGSLFQKIYGNSKNGQKEEATAVRGSRFDVYA